MTKSALTILTLIFTVAFITSCGKQDAPDYDYSKNHRLIELSNAIAENNSSLIISEVNAIKSSSPSDNLNMLCGILEAQIIQSNNYSTACKMLEDGAYEELNDFIAQIENQGYANPKLLRLRNLPQALLALEMFKSRMPWQNAEALEIGLSWLAPYRSILNQSPAFREFYAYQLKQLESMK